MMKKLLSVLLLGLTLLLTACGDKPGEQFVGTWQSSDNRFQYEIKRDENSKDAFIVKITETNPSHTASHTATVAGKVLDDTLIISGTFQFTIDPTTGEMIDHDIGERYKKSE